MSPADYVPGELRRRVAMQAGYRCGYCQTQVAVVGMPMEIEHLIPRSRGGRTTEENLWLACSLCNLYKGQRTLAEDPETARRVRLFNPRYQLWSRHFRWSDDGSEMIGITATARATVTALRLNRPVLVRSRRIWMAAGWHPPKD
jgi:hypothetical protein